jgi:hypothetical protein
VCYFIVWLNNISNTTSESSTNSVSSTSSSSPALVNAALAASGVTNPNSPEGFSNISTSTSTSIEDKRKADRKADRLRKQEAKILKEKAKFTEFYQIRNNIDTYLNTYLILVDTDNINDELIKRTGLTMQQIANKSSLSDTYFKRLINKLGKNNKDYSGLVYGLEDPTPFKQNSLNTILMRKLTIKRCDYSVPEKNTDPRDLIIYTGKCFLNNNEVLNEISKLDNAPSKNGKIIDKSKLTKTSMRKTMKDILLRYYNITNENDFNKKITSLVNSKDFIINNIENNFVTIFENIYNEQEPDVEEQDD